MKKNMILAVLAATVLCGAQADTEQMRNARIKFSHGLELNQEDRGRLEQQGFDPDSSGREHIKALKKMAEEQKAAEAESKNSKKNKNKNKNKNKVDEYQIEEEEENMGSEADDSEEEEDEEVEGEDAEDVADGDLAAGKGSVTDSKASEKSIQDPNAAKTTASESGADKQVFSTPSAFGNQV